MSESISGAPDPVRLSLEAESAKWFTRSLISGGVVAFGCLLEIWETAISVRNWFRARRDLTIKEDPKSWGIPIAAFGLLLVVWGIVAEVTYEGLASNADARLRAHESDVLSIAEANTAAADKKSGEAEKTAGELTKEAVQLRKDAEDERIARVEIEASVAWRDLTIKQKMEMGKRLRDLHPSEAITIWFSAGDAEGSHFASDIAEMLREAKMYVFPPRPLAPPERQTARVIDPIGRWATGVEVSSTSDPACRSLANAITEELEEYGFDAKTINSDAADGIRKSIGLPNVAIAVVARPNGPQGQAKLRAQAEKKQKTSNQAKKR